MHKIKLVHLLCQPDHEREIRSIRSLNPLKNLGLQYVAHVNPPWTSTPPKDFCRRPNDITEKNPGEPGQLWAGHYGAFLAWKQAIEMEFSDSVDFLMICEADCLLLVSPETFMQEVYKACDFMLSENVIYLSFGNQDTKEKSNGPYTIVPKIFKSHCVIFPRSIRDYMIQCYKEYPWDNDDFWKNWIFRNHKIAITNQTLAVQLGYSLIDHKMDIPNGFFLQ